VLISESAKVLNDLRGSKTLKLELGKIVEAYIAAEVSANFFIFHFILLHQSRVILLIKAPFTCMS
jgi:hypothetical protein